MPKQFRQSRPKAWFYATVEPTSHQSLAAGAQATIVDETLDHPTSGQDYGPGTLSGLRMQMEVYPNAALTQSPYYVILLLPASLSVPTVNTDATLKANEQYVWGVVLMERTGASGAGDILFSRIVFRSKRKINEGDRLAVVLVNVGAVAFGAAALATVGIDTYVQRSG